ncbi:MAG: hypothetical protein ABI886_14455 [Betaproteobacteria bacterium]
MKKLTKQVKLAAALAMGIAAGFLIPTNAAFAESQSYEQLSGEWWQWALSMPVADNPLADATGEKCMVGQRGSTWFLAGTFGTSTATRECSIPADATLFFPVINSVAFDTPNACGQDPTPLPSAFYRGLAADFINGATNLSVLVDGKLIRQLHRVKSKVFDVALPEDNLFAAVCEPYGGLPAGIYSPAIDDGIYVRLNPLAVGPHTLQIHAENPSAAGFVLAVTYHLEVVPVVSR